jgi:asparagine synthase (glutamine-hydrolysing)
MGGDGGDELFAGFDRYAGLNYVNYYAAVPALLRRSLLGPALARIPDNFGYKNRTQKLRWVHQLSLLRDTAERYAEATFFFRFNGEGKRALYGEALWQEVGALNSADVIAQPFRSAPAGDVIDRMLYADYHTRLPEHSLMLTDRMTMAHSLELRSPLLDHELVEYLAAFPSPVKIRGGELKHVLRQLAGDYLPPSIVRRDKQGFMFPIAYWFRQERYALLSAMLLDSFFVREGLFRRTAVQRLLEEHRDGRVDNHVRLWMLLNLSLWHQIYVQGTSVADAGEMMKQRETVAI